MTEFDFRLRDFVFKVSIIIFQSCYDAGLCGDTLEVVNVVHDPDHWLHVFHRDFALVDLLHKLAADLVYPEPVLPKLSVHVFPDAIRVCCQVVLSPDEV